MQCGCRGCLTARGSKWKVRKVSVVDSSDLVIVLLLLRADGRPSLGTGGGCVCVCQYLCFFVCLHLCVGVCVSHLSVYIVLTIVCFMYIPSHNACVFGQFMSLQKWISTFTKSFVQLLNPYQISKQVKKSSENCFEWIVESLFSTRIHFFEKFLKLSLVFLILMHPSAIFCQDCNTQLL